MTDVFINYMKYTSLFGGMGFHNSEAGMYRLIEPEYFNRVVSKCNREVSPGFMRTWGGFAEWTKQAMDEFFEYYTKMQKKTDTTIYIVPGRGISRENPEARRKWASDVADRIAYLYQKGMRHLRYYCMSNELSLDGWGTMTHKLEVFKEYQEYLWREFQKRDLPIGLLATDAAHYKNWNTIEWAMQNISYMTDAYCGHLYIGELFDCEDLGLYKWAYNIFCEFSNQARLQEKRFILGEYGWGGIWEKAVGSTIDVPRYVHTEKEAYSFLSLAEVSLAALNAGVYTMSFWTFLDYPDPQSRAWRENSGDFSRKWSESMKYLGWGTDVRYNQCGLLHWNKPENPAYDGYWCLGLMCRYLKKDSRLLQTICEDDLLRMGAVHHNDGSVSICIVNRHPHNVDIKLHFDFPQQKDLRVFRYDTDHVPRNQFADLQPYDCMSKLEPDNTAQLQLHGSSVTVITTEYIDRIPTPIENISVNENQITWKPCSDAEHCYYRVYQNGVQIASTVESYLNHIQTDPAANYTVCSVDIYGNCAR